MKPIVVAFRSTAFPISVTAAIDETPTLHARIAAERLLVIRFEDPTTLPPSADAFLRVLSADQSRFEHNPRHRREGTLLSRSQEGKVRDPDEVVRDLPQIFFRGHPTDAVEPREVERSRVPAQRLLAAQVEVPLNVREHEVPHGPKDGLPEPEAGVVGSSDRPPQAVAAINRDHVVVVEDRLEIDDERRLALQAQRRRSEQRPVHALNSSLTKYAPRRPAALAAHVVVE